jgi:hypothetical protein
MTTTVERPDSSENEYVQPPYPMEGFELTSDVQDMTPEDAFAAHVEMVRNHGDALDINMHSHSYHGKLGVRSAAGLAAGETLAFMSDGFHPSALGVATIGVAGLSYSVLKEQHTKIKMRKLKEADARENIGEGYELYRVTDRITGKPEIVMRWYGTRSDVNDQPRSPRESLETIATLAEDNGIRAIIAAPEDFHSYAEAAERHANGKLQAVSWLRNVKRVKVEIHEDDQRIDPELLAISPANLRLVAAETRTKHEVLPDLESLIQIIRNQKPEHPLVRTFDTYAKDQDNLASNIWMTARRSLERRLEDVMAVWDVNDRGMPQRWRMHIQGAVRGDNVRWQGSGEAFGRHSHQQPLLDALEMPAIKIHDVLLHPKSHYPNDVILAAECAAYLEVNQPPAPTAEEDVSPLEATSLPLQYQAADSFNALKSLPLDADPASKRRITSDMRYALKTIAHVAVVASAVVFPVAVDVALNTQRTAIYEQSEDDYRKVYGLDALDPLDLDQQGAAHAVGMENHPFISAYATFHDAASERFEQMEAELSFGARSATDVQELLDADPGNASGLGSGSSSIGNIAPGEYEMAVEWQLTPLDGAETAGYWATDTHTNLTEYGLWEDSAVPHQTIYPRSGEEADVPPSSIIVERELGRHDMPDPITQNVPKVIYISIPVLQGMQPVSAQYGGERIPIQWKTDGTYGVAISTELREEIGLFETLRYTIAPKAEGVTDPHATGLVEIENNYQHEELMRSIDEWNQQINLEINPDQNRLDSIMSFMQENMHYSYAPLTEETFSDLRQGNASYNTLLTEQLRRRTANCNVASTMVALGVPQLNAASGYNEDGDGSLRAGEAHMWLVNKNGELLDPTPSRSEIAPSDESGEYPAALKLLALGGLATAASGLAGLRLATRRWTAEQQLKLYSAKKIHTAKQVADIAAYAKEVNLSKVQPLALHATRSEVLQNLSQSQVHSEYVADSLKNAISSSPWKDKRQLRKAQKIIRTMQRAGMDQKLVDVHDISGILT